MSDTSENGLSGQALGFMRQAIELSEENVRPVRWGRST